MSVVRQRQIFDFWFAGIPRERWFKSSPEFDAEIRERFEETWHAARAGGFQDWLATPKGTLALIILLDQFPRNMFRGQAEAFATDSMAREAARVALARGFDSSATDDERNFLYLPFMHSEALADQELCLRLTRENLGEQHSSFSFAVRHRDAILRFGRFPARNEALARSSSEEEKSFLAQHPSGF